MIKKMKLKFIMIAGIAVVVVLFIVLGLVNCINFYNNLYESYQTLEVILDNDGFLPASQSEVWMHDIIFTEDSQFEERYFYAIVDGDDSIIMMNMDFIASLKQEDVDKLAPRKGAAAERIRQRKAAANRKPSHWSRGLLRKAGKIPIIYGIMGLSESEPKGP